MLSMFESMVRQNPRGTCFTFVDSEGIPTIYSYREVRLLSAALACYLQSRGVQPGDYVAIDLPNSPAFVHFILAAAYGEFTLLILNNRLSSSEKLSRLMEIERTSDIPISARVDETNVDEFMDCAMALLSNELDITEASIGRAVQTMRGAESARGSGRASARSIGATGIFAPSATRSPGSSGPIRRVENTSYATRTPGSSGPMRRIENTSQDPYDRYASQGSHVSQGSHISRDSRTNDSRYSDSRTNDSRATYAEHAPAHAAHAAHTSSYTSSYTPAHTSANTSAGTSAHTPAHASHGGFVSHPDIADLEPRTSQALGRATPGSEAVRRRNEQALQDAVENVIHYAEHAAHTFDRDEMAVVMFTSGTTGRAKAVPLTWENLCSSSEISNATLCKQGEGLWQAVLPLYHVGGFQIIVRSLLNCSQFVLYEHFDPDFLLTDGVRRGATHVSVVDKILHDMLATGKVDALRKYECILLGGGAPNPSLIEQVRALNLRVFVSYGMTETSSQIADAQVTASFDGGLRLLPGYEAHIVDPDKNGYGRLAVQGPGLFQSYINARVALTLDGFFLTGDTAAIKNGLLYVRERTEDVFVSGGENIYPAEIAERILTIPGVRDTYVFGASDAKWGRRPVAFVEVDKKTAARALAEAGITSFSSYAFEKYALEKLRPQLSKINLPQHILVLDAFPRNAGGKIDREMLQQLYENRLQITSVTLHRIRLPFKTPFKTAKGVLTARESVIVEVSDYAGRTGLSECVAFPADWYMPETLDQDLRVLQETLIPAILNEVFLHPSEVAAMLFSFADGANFPMASGAIEPAFWDLYGKIANKPLWQLIGASYAAQDSVTTAIDMEKNSLVGEATISVPAGAVVGVGPVGETAAAARRCVSQGYTRIKMKTEPGNALACVEGVKAAAPNVIITLDANQSFTERDLSELRTLDSCGAAWIEEPLNPNGASFGVSTDLFSRLARLQRELHTPICLDESIANPRDITNAFSHPELRCYSVKIGRLGGVQHAIEFIRTAQQRGITVWMGGMYDTGISKRIHAAFETLPDVNAPGDIGATSRYFDTDITIPPHTVERGLVTLNREGYQNGIGCELNRNALEDVLVESIVIES